MYQGLTDEQLLQMLHGNDEEAFAEIYDRYWEKMALYSLKVIRSSEDASDIVQEVFVSIWKRRHELVINGPLLPYLLKSVRNLSIRYIEKNLRKLDFLSSLSYYCEHLDLSSVNELETKELENKLAGVVASLPSRMQTVYLLSRHEHLSYREIAQQLGIAETTVKKQVSNALKVIRNQISGLSVNVYLLFTTTFFLWYFFS